MTQYSGKIIRKNPVVPTQASASGVWTTEDAAVAVRNNTWPVAGVPDPISRSLRFRASASAYLNRTATSATNNLKWTYSCWVKRGALGATNYILSGGDATYRTGLYFNDTTNTIGFFHYNSSTYPFLAESVAVFRDPSAWYHVVFVFDCAQATSSNGLKLYVNGVQQTLTITYYTQNNGSTINNTAYPNWIGWLTTTSNYLDGYLTEVNFIDGQALTPSSFGTTDPETGAWEPMQYTGTYGANGFYLDFRDNTSTTTLGYDYSGNANNWTANNISLTAGATYDSMLDVPTPWVGYSATTDTTAVTRGNYATLNPLASVGATLSNANLTLVTAVSGTSYALGTIGIPTNGKWYWEYVGTSNGNEAFCGVMTSSTALILAYYGATGIKWVNGASSAYGATYTTNDVIGVAVDVGAGTVTFYKNNTSQGAITYSVTADTFFPYFADGSSSASTTFQVNFGQRPFTYTPPADHKALCVTNLPDPTIKLGASYMAASTYTGTGATLSIVNSGNNTTATTFAPDFVWIKDRSAARSHRLFDTVRGATKALFSDATDAETTLTTDLTAFNSNGFTLGVGAGSNSSGETFVGWQWKAAGSTVSNTSGTITSTVSANTTAGFSIVTYTGTGANATVGHGLGVAPSMVIVKTRSVGTYDWCVYHASLTSASYYLPLSGSAAQTLSTNVWNATAPTSTVFSIGTSVATNQSSQTLVAYCFAAVAGYSKFGSYTGNGSTDGPFVYCGFRPRFIMTKNITTAGYWWEMVDSSREPINPSDQALYANVADAEYTSSTYNKDLLSNGFKMRGNSAAQNASGDVYIYMAFAENPFKYSNAR
jgi:hypothetical protein